MAARKEESGGMTINIHVARISVIFKQATPRCTTYIAQHGAIANLSGKHQTS